jgi:hypothetical protein
MVPAKIRLLGAHAPSKHNRGAAMSKKNSKSKTVIFTLTMPKTEIPFARLSTSLKKFGKMRQAFESIALDVQVVDFKK